MKVSVGPEVRTMIFDMMIKDNKGRVVDIVKMNPTKLLSALEVLGKDNTRLMKSKTFWKYAFISSLVTTAIMSKRYLKRIHELENEDKIKAAIDQLKREVDALDYLEEEDTNESEEA